MFLYLLAVIGQTRIPEIHYVSHIAGLQTHLGILHKLRGGNARWQHSVRRRCGRRWRCRRLRGRHRQHRTGLIARRAAVTIATSIAANSSAAATAAAAASGIAKEQSPGPLVLQTLAAAQHLRSPRQHGLRLTEASLVAVAPVDREQHLALPARR